MAEPEYVTATVTYRVVINNEDVVRRCTENVDGWQDDFYMLKTRADVLQHLAYNLGLHDLRLSQLEGWADLPDDAVTVTSFTQDWEMGWTVASSADETPGTKTAAFGVCWGEPFRNHSNRRWCEDCKPLSRDKYVARRIEVAQSKLIRLHEEGQEEVRQLGADVIAAFGEVRDGE